MFRLFNFIFFLNSVFQFISIDFPQRNVKHKRMLQRAHRRHHININCVDSLGRGSLTIAIDSENLEMVELLVIMGVETKDALLQVSKYKCSGH